MRSALIDLRVGMKMEGRYGKSDELHVVLLFSGQLIQSQMEGKAR